MFINDYLERKIKECEQKQIDNSIQRISFRLGRKPFHEFKYKNFIFDNSGIYLESRENSLLVKLRVNSYGEWQVDGILLEKSKEALNEVLKILDSYDEYILKQEAKRTHKEEIEKQEAIDYFTKKFKEEYTYETIR